MKTHPAKQFVLQLGSLASLYISLGFFLALVFGLTNLLFPDSLDSSWQINSAHDMVRFGFAMTIVFFPTYLALTRVVNSARRTSSDHAYLGLTKWLIYLSLLVGGAVLLGDMVAIIMGFLEGELTDRFVVKAGAVLGVTGAAFYYYVRDAQGYWITRSTQSLIYGAVASAIIFSTLVFAILYIDSPKEVRERNIDEQQVSDLREWQWAIDSYLSMNQELPQTAADITQHGNSPLHDNARTQYTYNLTEEGFELCATFAYDSRDTDQFMMDARWREGDVPYIQNSEDWGHEAGEWCFKRTLVFAE